MNSVDKIRSYLAGETSLKKFYDEVMQDKDLQAYLEQDAPLPPYIKDDSIFLYMMSQDPGKPGSDVNIRDALSKFLNALGVEHRVDEGNARKYDLVLDAAPSWIYMPEEYTAKLIDSLPERYSRTAAVKMIKDKIAKDFRYMKKPPRWLQDARWPVIDGKPLVFIGQLDLGELMHDDAQVYVFFHGDDKSFHTITQVA